MTRDELLTTAVRGGQPIRLHWRGVKAGGTRVTFAIVGFLCFGPWMPIADCAYVRVPLPGVESYIACRAAITSLARGLPKPWELRMGECTEEK